MRFPLITISVIIFALNLAGQSFTRITGEVTVEGGEPQARYIVELIEPSRRQTVDRAIVTTNGRFDFPVAEGEYDLRLIAQNGDVLRTERVNTASASPNIELSAEIKRPQRPAEGAVSVYRLQHRTVRKAAKEFRKATDLSDKGDLTGSIEHLKRAIEIDPDYMEAHHDLGCKYLRLGDEQAAARELERSIELDPGSSRAYANLTIVYLRLGRVPNAESAAKRAFALDARSPLAHYVLGMVRFAERRYDSETLHHLEVAQEKFPFAEKPAAAVRSVMVNSLVKH